MKIELLIRKDGNNILGNFYRVSAWCGDNYLGEKIFAGYNKRESVQRAREIIKDRGRFN
jgi:hypothetical protein